ncbi:MAG: hypothetical protein ACRD1X_21505 [Vicinamibacteria bacterium]
MKHHHTRITSGLLAGACMCAICLRHEEELPHIHAEDHSPRQSRALYQILASGESIIPQGMQGLDSLYLFGTVNLSHLELDEPST